ncbi:hypothetical protein [Veillonella rogosae]|uniref:hypothetical protein n=1 Tax=Veillonella rogosae TaxID=423477 RepID=UPI00142E430E|nr:hypothetical protein [Veillonella rogosae]
MNLKIRRQRPGEEPNIYIDHANDNIVIVSTFYLRALVYGALAFIFLLAYFIISLFN